MKKVFKSYDLIVIFGLIVKFSKYLSVYVLFIVKCRFCCILFLEGCINNLDRFVIIMIIWMCFKYVKVFELFII